MVIQRSQLVVDTYAAGIANGEGHTTEVVGHVGAVGVAMDGGKVDVRCKGGVAVGYDGWVRAEEGALVVLVETTELGPRSLAGTIGMGAFPDARLWYRLKGGEVVYAEAVEWM